MERNFTIVRTLFHFKKCKIFKYRANGDGNEQRFYDSFPSENCEIASLFMQLTHLHLNE